MDDLISRQAAIDAVRDRMGKGETHIGDTFIECFEMILNALPSAQPEIIRCKKCLMHGVCRFEQGLGLNGYCSQAERREE